MSRIETTLIAGLGSPHGDDQLGWAAIDCIRPVLPAGATAFKLSNPLELLDRIAGVQRLIVIDATVSGGRPAGIRRFIWPCPGLSDSEFLSTHGVGLNEALRLAEELGDLPRHVTIYAIEAGVISAGLGLSEAAAHGLEVVAEAVAHEAAECAGMPTEESPCTELF